MKKASEECLTTIWIVCTHKEDAEKIYKQLKEWEKEPELESYLMLAMGYSMEYLESHGLTSCGQIRSIEFDGLSIIQINVWSLNEPYLKMWKLIMDKHWPGVSYSILYDSMVAENDWYASNKKSCMGSVYVYSGDADINVVRYDKTKELQADLLEFLNDKGICPEKTDLKSLKKEFDYLGFDLTISPIQYIPIEELN